MGMGAELHTSDTYSATRAERLATIERHIHWIECAFDDPKSLSNSLKKYVSAYSRGLRDSSHFRQQTQESEDPNEILDLTRRYFAAVDPAPVLQDQGQVA